MTKRETKLCELAEWLHRHRAEFNGEFSGPDIARKADRESVRYFGMLKLKTPKTRMVVQMPEPDRTALRALGFHDFAKGTIYQERVGPRRIGWDTPELVPWFCRGRSAAGITRLLTRLVRSGTLEVVDRSRPKRYRFVQQRVAFGAADALIAARKEAPHA